MWSRQDSLGCSRDPFPFLSCCHPLQEKQDLPLPSFFISEWLGQAVTLDLPSFWSSMAEVVVVFTSVYAGMK